MSRIKTVKYFSDKVAVVYGVASPVATCICLKLIQQGACVILMDEEQRELAASLSRDLNLLWAGLDTNDNDGWESWKARPVVTHFCVSGSHEQNQNVSEFSLRWFGKLPQLLIDVSSVLAPIDVHHLISAKGQDLSVCIQPLNCGCLWTTGWLGTIPCEDLDPAEAPWEDIAVYSTTSWDLIRNLIKDEQTEFQLSDSRGFWVMKTDDLFMVLAYLLHGGLYITADDFKTQVKTKGNLSVSNPSPFYSHHPSVEIKKMELATLLNKSTEECTNHQSPDPAMMKDSSDGLKDSKVWSNDLELIEEDGYITTDSDLVKHQTFDALLQKTKDYPVDWWQGGCERFISVDDINCKGLAKAAVNFAVRWAVLGYFVIGFAVPKILGWTGP